MPDPQSQLDALRSQRDAAKRSAAEKRAAIRETERSRVRAIDRRIRRAESQLKGQARRDDTRWSILVGVWTRSRMEASTETREKVRRGLAGYLSRPQDRELAAKILGEGWDRA